MVDLTEQNWEPKWILPKQPRYPKFRKSNRVFYIFFLACIDRPAWSERLASIPFFFFTSCWQTFEAITSSHKNPFYSSNIDSFVIEFHLNYRALTGYTKLKLQRIDFTLLAFLTMTKFDIFSLP